MLLLVVALIATLTCLWYLYRKQSLSYWKKRGFPTLTDTNVLFGDCGPALLGRQSFIELYRDAHFAFKQRGHKIGGIYLMNLPMLLVTDNELMKKMLQTDFEAFAHRGVDLDMANNPLSAHMFSLDVDEWHKIRRRITPTFTSGKIKVMLPIVSKHIDVLIKVTRQLCDNGNADLNYSEWLDRAGVDVIGHVAFGLDCNTLEKQNDEFFTMTQRFTRPNKWKAMKLLLSLKNPANVVTLLSSDKKMTQFFINLIKDTITHRQQNKIRANDFLQFLVELFEEEGGLSMPEVAAQAFMFFIAGYDTTSRAVNFALYSLAKDPETQTKLRAAIQKDLDANGGEYTYDWIMNNEYLDMVIKETLRLYPPVMTLNRMAIHDYPLNDLGLVVPKGTCMVFSSMGFHYDAEHFPNPMEFQAERFSKANVANIKPFTNVPFGDGPRGCLGKRFGYLQTKLTLAKILINFEVMRSDKTEYPMKISPLTMSLFLTPRDPIYFKFKPLQ